MKQKMNIDDLKLELMKLFTIDKMIPVLFNGFIYLVLLIILYLIYLHITKPPLSKVGQAKRYKEAMKVSDQLDYKLMIAKSQRDLHILSINNAKTDI